MVGGTATNLSQDADGGFVPVQNAVNTVWMRVRVTGSSPTQVLARAWADGSAEPGTWQLSFTDSTAALQASGGVGLNGSTPTSGTTFDSLPVTSPGAGVAPGPSTARPPTPAAGPPR